MDVCRRFSLIFPAVQQSMRKREQFLQVSVVILFICFYVLNISTSSKEAVFSAWFITSLVCWSCELFDVADEFFKLWNG